MEWTDDRIRQELMRNFEAGSDGLKIVVPVAVAELICQKVRGDCGQRIEELEKRCEKLEGYLVQGELCAVASS